MVKAVQGTNYERSPMDEKIDIKVKRNADGTHRTEVPPKEKAKRQTRKVKNKVNEIMANPALQTNAKWALGTVKGVAKHSLSSSAAILAGALVEGALNRPPKHERRTNHVPRHTAN